VGISLFSGAGLGQTTGTQPPSDGLSDFIKWIQSLFGIQPNAPSVPQSTTEQWSGPDLE